MTRMRHDLRRVAPVRKFNIAICIHGLFLGMIVLKGRKQKHIYACTLCSKRYSSRSGLHYHKMTKKHAVTAASETESQCSSGGEAPVQSFIYLVQDGKHLGTNIYKVGRTSQRGGDSRVIRRLRTGYSRKTKQIYIRSVPTDDVALIESCIIHRFNRLFKIAEGREWFEGDVKAMVRVIHHIIDKVGETECC